MCFRISYYIMQYYIICGSNITSYYNISLYTELYYIELCMIECDITYYIMYRNIFKILRSCLAYTGSKRCELNRAVRIGVATGNQFCCIRALHVTTPTAYGRLKSEIVGSV